MVVPRVVDVRRAVPADIDSASRCVDVVARERAYIGSLEGPPLEQSRSFWLPLIEQSLPFIVAADGATVEGWCDIVPMPRPVFAHARTLGMGLLRAGAARALAPASWRWLSMRRERVAWSGSSSPSSPTPAGAPAVRENRLRRRLRT
jgi:hypothetical protein